jgi:hypothetical protein
MGGALDANTRRGFASHVLGTTPHVAMSDPPQLSQSARPHHQHHQITAGISPTPSPQRPHSSMAGHLSDLTNTDQEFSIGRCAPAPLHATAEGSADADRSRSCTQVEGEARAVRRAPRRRWPDAPAQVHYVRCLPAADRGAVEDGAGEVTRFC